MASVLTSPDVPGTHRASIFPSVKWGLVHCPVTSHMKILRLGGCQEGSGDAETSFKCYPTTPPPPSPRFTQESQVFRLCRCLLRDMAEPTSSLRV